MFLKNRSDISQRRFVTIAVSIAVAASFLWGCAPIEEDQTAAPAEQLAVITPRPVETTTSTAPPTTLPALPEPDPLPLEPHTNQPIPILGNLRIPDLGVDQTLAEGMSLSAINTGPSWWPGTAEPGQMGNMVIAGHRTTYSRPFHDLDLVEPGMEMIIDTAEGDSFIYRATHTEIVDEESLWIADQDYRHTATTFACHPKGSSAQRIVVFWELLDANGNPVPPLA